MTSARLRPAGGLEQAAIVNTLDNLMTFPRLAKLIEKGKIATHGAYFGLATGDLSALDRASGEFQRIAPELTAFSASRF